MLPPRAAALACLLGGCLASTEVCVGCEDNGSFAADANSSSAELGAAAASSGHDLRAFTENVYVLAYLSGALSFWVTTGTLFYLQVACERTRRTWAPRGEHGLDSWRTAFRKAAWNLHVSLPSFVAFCAVLSFKAFRRYGIDDPAARVRWVGGTWSQMAGTMAIMAFVDDLVFWSAHAALHSHPFLFKNIHALHHRYHNPIAPAVFCENRSPLRSYPAELSSAAPLPFRHSLLRIR